jgi:hypothetical protein
MLFILILVILFGIGLYYKQNKIVFSLLLLAGIMIMGLNYDNPDYINYERAFKRAEFISEFSIFERLDIGTGLILAGFKDFGFTQYAQFRLAYTTVLFIIFGITILNSCKYPNIILAIYLAFYIVLDEIQMRNFSSFVFFLPFLLYFSSHQNAKGILVYLLGVILAFTLHFSAIFYLIFVFSIFKSKWTQYFLFACCVVFLTLVGSSFSDMAMIDHVEHYTVPSVAGALISCFLLIFNYLFVRYSLKKTRHIDWKLKGSVTFVRRFDVLTRFNFLLMFLMPIIFINSTVLRIWRFTSILNIIFLLGLVFYLHTSKSSRILLLYTFLYAGVISAWFSYEGVWSSLLNNPLF